MQRVAKANMKETTQLLNNLRKIFQKPPGLTEEPIAAYIVPSDDAHNSEYICPHDERRAFISGFDGSAGTAVITNEQASLWTDGRYYQQAEKQLDSNWTLMKDGLPTTPRIGAWLAKNLQKGSKIGFDPKLISYRAWQPIKADLDSNECQLVPIEENLIDIIWNNQPCQPKKPIITLDLSFSGQTVKDKWHHVLKDMDDKKVDCLIVSALDEVAWFLNMRGDDIGYNPVFFGYLMINHNDIMLFVDSSKLPNDFDEHQKNNQVKIKVLEYDYLKTAIQNINSESDKKIWIAPTSSYFLNTLIPKKKLHQEITPICLMKAIKNPTECEGFIQCHIRDGVALCQYFAWLEEALKKGEYVDEISGATKLKEFRSIKDHFKGISFSTISSSGPNGSVIHYHPKPETNRQIVDKEIYLCDSGAQYLDGTTDVTRTMHFGEPTDFQKEAYTRVLKGQLGFAATVFPKKVKGQVLDTLARKSLWDIGLDYGHGTGHGVGHFLNVHEGPIGCGIRLMPDDPGLQENMFISNEPGYYKDGEFGLRIEDIVQIIEVKPQFDFAGRGALSFKTITMCPKQTKMIKKELLTETEIKQLNDYHKKVLDTLSPLLEKDGDTLTLEWLRKETAPI